MAIPLRDHYGLRTKACTHVGFSEASEEEREEGKERVQQLNKLLKRTQQLRDAMDLNHFVSVSLEGMSRRLLGENQLLPTAIPSLASLQHPNQDQDQLINLERERIEIERRLTDIDTQNSFLLLLLHRLNSAILDLNNTKLVSDINNGNDSEKPFYRYHRNPSHKVPSQSLWKQDVGIVCPGWRKHDSADSEVTKTCVRQHLADSDRSYPPFISVSDDPARIHKTMSLNRERTDSSASILIISPSRLLTMGITYRKSTDLVRELGMNPYCSEHSDGVHYATNSHWMIHRWVPKECIVNEMSISRVETFCTARGILRQESANGPSSLCYNIRPSLGDVLSSKPDNNTLRMRTYVSFTDANAKDPENGKLDQHAIDLTARLAKVTL